MDGRQVGAEVLQVKEQQPKNLWTDGSGASWKREYKRLENEIRLRHRSDKTLWACRVWMQKFQAYTRSKGPDLLSTDDVKFLGMNSTIFSAPR
jgi:hypothetical protein